MLKTSLLLLNFCLCVYIYIELELNIKTWKQDIVSSTLFYLHFFRTILFYLYIFLNI